MKKIILTMIFITTSLPVTSKVAPRKLDVVKPLTCPESLVVNLSVVPKGFTSLNNAQLKFISSNVSQNYAECTYQYLNYETSKQVIWFYCDQSQKAVRVDDRTFYCQ
jgi:hypothetical protein